MDEKKLSPRGAVNLTLKTAIFAAGKSQRQIAAASGIPENRFSEIIRGWTRPRPSERHAIAAALGQPVADLFEGDVLEPEDQRQTA